MATQMRLLRKIEDKKILKNEIYRYKVKAEAGRMEAEKTMDSEKLKRNSSRKDLHRSKRKSMKRSLDKCIISPQLHTLKANVAWCSGLQKQNLAGEIKISIRNITKCLPSDQRALNWCYNQNPQE